MALVFRSIDEAQPGPKLAGLFAGYWPAYRKWWAQEGYSARPTYRECLRALLEHMPEIMPLYEEVVELVGGSDSQARFLSLYCPPKYLSGCSQAIWRGDTPFLVRNYDYHPRTFDAAILKTQWLGRGVIGMSDGILGLLDGVNDAGLMVSLTFGGRTQVGPGFGVPMILRYVLQICETTAEAVDCLCRIPCHMSYNVTVLDAKGKYATVYMAPDRVPEVTDQPVATNHQSKVEWPTHARFTATVERERFLLQRLTLHPEGENRFIDAFLRPPLYSTAFSSGFGTLYTAVYRHTGQISLMWPGAVWNLSFDNFTEGTRRILFPTDTEATGHGRTVGFGNL
ncbi:C45 family autoproteolytic acyltransferase/hydolase [Ruegeria sp. EL01]|jgi:predicted choloylglycine hydrolase|uniref:C45 family autoproteolytic acyltransferase/hydolase n=1 Tax=Ruegeria sp. EL01 TaxID=2107578 RepID=UPI000EA80B6D|nr:C45 family peptidase [Ruegeria sp. EL01]